MKNLITIVALSLLLYSCKNQKIQESKTVIIPKIENCEELNIYIDSIPEAQRAEFLRVNGSIICTNGLEECVEKMHLVEDTFYDDFWQTTKETTSFKWEELKKLTDNICYQKYLGFYKQGDSIKVKYVDIFTSGGDTTCYSAVLFKGIAKNPKVLPTTVFTFAQHDTSKDIIFLVRTGLAGSTGSVAKYNYIAKPTILVPNVDE